MQASRFKSTAAGTFRFGQTPLPMPSSIEDDDDSQTKSHCDFCDRPSGNVFCRACGHIFRGRVRGRCPRHPELILLMDYEVCTECHSSVLKEYGAGPTVGGDRASSTSVTTSLPTTTQPFTPGSAAPGAQGRRERRVAYLPSGTALSRSKGIRP